MPRPKRTDRISDPGPLLRVMRPCREAMTSAMATVKPMGATYHGLSMVVAAIDALAVMLVGRESYFWTIGGGSTRAETEKRAVDEEAERGG